MKLTILTTGGTIDKTYDEFQGSLRNQHTVIDVILDSLRIPDLDVHNVEVMHKDSLDMTEEDREIIARAVCDEAPTADAVVILHGTDTLSDTGEFSSGVAPVWRFRSSSPARCGHMSFGTRMPRKT